MSRSPRFAAAPGQDQLERWRQALSAAKRTQRARRWKRPAPEITGIRIPPPAQGAKEGTK